jgi:hyperosmotically inducible periplasmic protein
MKMKQSLLAALMAAVFVTMITGCPRETPPSPPPEAVQEQDREITDRVREALDEAEVYKFPEVQVQTRAAQVQLSGFVQTTEQRRAAADIARQVPGVEDVINNITVQD